MVSKPDSQTIEPSVEPLTKREREILFLLADRLSDREIAERLTLALSSVKWYARQIYSKLGVNSRRQAIARANTLGLLKNAMVPSMPQHNLPAQLTSFISREKEIHAIEEQLLNPNCRLLTLIGPGGIGKTRLGLQVATGLLARFKDGVFFIDLLPIDRPDLVITTIAKALALLETPGRPIQDILIDYLRDKKLLLFLDNFEQVIEVAPLITDLLLASPELKVLVTSREVLHLSGEQIYSVFPLALPTLETPEPLPVFKQCASVQLFLQRAKAATAGFEITSDNAPLVAGICVRLDGLPLAIELAAALTRFFTLEDLNKRLSDRFEILIGGPRDVHTHQQTLRATFDWSYNLLMKDEQRLFARLAIFQGSFSSAAAEKVCGDHLSASQSPTLDRESAALLNHLFSLVEKSLVIADTVRPGSPRYRLLETLRHYAEIHLAEHGEMETVKRRHATYYLTLAEEADRKLHGPEQIAWLSLLETERDNLRAALDWAVKNDPETGLRLASALWWFWITRGYFNEGREWLERFLASETASLPDLLNVKAYVRYVYLMSFLVEDDQLYQMAEEGLKRSRLFEDLESMAISLLFMSGKPYHTKEDTKSLFLLEESVDLFRQANNPWGTAVALRSLAELMLVRYHKSLEAKKLCFEALALSRQNGNISGISKDLLLLGNIEDSLGNWEMAYAYYQEGFSNASALGDRSSMAYLLWRMANVAETKKEFEQAIALRWESVKIYRDTSQKEYHSTVLAGIAYLKLILGQIEEALELTGECLKIAEQLKRKELRWYPHFILGEVARSQGDYAKSTHLHCQALKFKRELSGNQEAVLYSLMVLTILSTSQLKFERAVKLFSATEMLGKAFSFIEIPFTLADWDDSHSKARAQLDEQSYALAWKQGLDMAAEGWERVIAYAIQEMLE